LVFKKGPYDFAQAAPKSPGMVVAHHQTSHESSHPRALLSVFLKTRYLGGEFAAMTFDPKNYLQGKRSLAKKDASLKALLAKHRLSFTPQEAREPFESLVRAIAHQQLHGKAAETILGRMRALFPKRRFPKPQELLSHDSSTLRACGFSTSKTKSILDIALKTHEGLVPSRKAIVQMDNEEIIQTLLPIYGVGRWTVEMLLIFQLGRLDVWPVDDFGVRRGFQIWKCKRVMPTPKELKPYARSYAPYASIVALHLWREADLAKNTA